MSYAVYGYSLGVPYLLKEILLNYVHIVNGDYGKISLSRLIF